jgi:uncharacterized lipoprotein YajG
MKYLLIIASLVAIIIIAGCTSSNQNTPVTPSQTAPVGSVGNGSTDQTTCSFNDTCPLQYPNGTWYLPGEKNIGCC